MRAKRVTNALTGWACLLTGVLALTGCIKQDRGNCPRCYTLKVRVAETTASDDASLFLFDARGGFIRKIETRVGETITIDEGVGKDLTVVSWGDLNQGGQSWTEPSVGDQLADCFVSLVPHTRAAAPMRSPDDLFWGRIELEAGDPARDKVLPISRQVGSMAVTVRSLKEFTGQPDQEYHIEVRETPSRIAFADGALSGPQASYRPSGAFRAGKNPSEYFVDTFNLLPATGLHIDIYHRGTLTATISTDTNGNPIGVERGRLTNILIDMPAELSATVRITDWGKTEVWKEF